MGRPTTMRSAPSAAASSAIAGGIRGLDRGERPHERPGGIRYRTAAAGGAVIEGEHPQEASEWPRLPARPGEALAGRLRAVRSHLGAGDLPLVDVAGVMTGGRLACPVFGEGRLLLASRSRSPTGSGCGSGRPAGGFDRARYVALEDERLPRRLRPRVRDRHGREQRHRVGMDRALVERHRPGIARRSCRDT